MSDSRLIPWSDNPNAPKISYPLYFSEKTNFAGVVLGSIFYGIVVMVFIECMAALFNPVYRRREPVKWGLVSYTVAMFSAATIFTGMNLEILSISYIDNRKYPGATEGIPMPPGPYGYQIFIAPEAINVIPNVVFNLSDWLADGLLLYRCYIIYSMNLWVIALPCLLYLGSVATGILFTYETVERYSRDWPGVAYFSTSLSLNVLLTLMIVIRLILHTRNTRNAMGMTGIDGLCKTVITMLIESCALYAVSTVLVIGPWSVQNTVAGVFITILSQTQVIAPLLVILRVADKSALTNKSLASGRISTFKARSRGELTVASGAIPGGDPASSVDEHEMNAGELGVGVETTIDSYLDEVY